MLRQFRKAAFQRATDRPPQVRNPLAAVVRRARPGDEPHAGLVAPRLEHAQGAVHAFGQKPPVQAAGARSRPAVVLHAQVGDLDRLLLGIHSPASGPKGSVTA
jgi:hypothetical protein